MVLFLFKKVSQPFRRCLFFWQNAFVTMFPVWEKICFLKNLDLKDAINYTWNLLMRKTPLFTGLFGNR